MLEEFRQGIEGLGRQWDLWYAMRVTNVDPSWFIDERTLEVLKVYLFSLPNPAQAFPGGPFAQPSIWPPMKMCIDEAFESQATQTQDILNNG